MSRYFHACERCGCAGVEGQFRLCGSCTGKPPITATNPVTEEEQSLASLEEIAASDEIRLRRIHAAYRLSLRLRPFGALSKAQPK